MSAKFASVDDLAAEYARITALLPDCPVCGGTGREPTYADGGFPITMTERPCFDCDHGKVTVAQLVATWQAVHDNEWLPYDEGSTAANLRRHLRSVRPVSPSPKEGS